MRTRFQRTSVGNIYEFELTAKGPGKVELVDMFGRVYARYEWKDHGTTPQVGRFVDPDLRHGLEFKFTGLELRLGPAATTIVVDDVIDVESEEIRGEIDANRPELE